MKQPKHFIKDGSSYISMKEASKIVKTAPSTVYTWLKEGHDTIEKLKERKKKKRNGGFSAANLEGRQFGRLYVLGFAGYRKGNRMLDVKCDCGKELVVYQGAVLSGSTRSCGCLRKEVSRAQNPKKANYYKPKASDKMTFRSWYCDRDTIKCAKYDYCLWVLNFAPFYKYICGCFKVSLKHETHQLYQKMINMKLDKIMQERESSV